MSLVKLLLTAVVLTCCTAHRYQLESQIVSLKDMISKNVDPKLTEKINEIEKEIKKQTTDGKLFDIKKFADSILSTTKDVEVSFRTRKCA